jgi:hypothetical protein
MGYCRRNLKPGGTTVFVVLLVVSLALSTCAVHLCAQQADAAAGITRITRESRREAIRRELSFAVNRLLLLHGDRAHHRRVD